MNSKHVDHLLAPMLRIPNEPLPVRVNNPVHQLQGNLADEHWKLITNLADINRAITPLNRESDRAVKGDCHRASYRTRRAIADMSQNQQPLRTFRLMASTDTVPPRFVGQYWWPELMFGSS